LVESMKGIAVAESPVRRPRHMARSLRTPYLANLVNANNRKQLIVSGPGVEAERWPDQNDYDACIDSQRLKDRVAKELAQ
jgi:hypothetical protein